MQVIATAGHVDHGKSTLVRALTGMEPDRWAEERRRGMTLDLGFAWTVLAGGPGDAGAGGDAGGEDTTVAFVDVPGHERFVPTMLAGVGPVPAVMFVVAADEGWMPQSTEHLDALGALGTRHGLLVVTRADLADPEPALRDAQRQLASSPLGRLPSVCVSAVAGAGLPALRAALGELIRRLPAPDTDADARLWVDRAFTVRGAGTVVTGTLAAGRLEVGEELELQPRGRRVTVRGLQRLGEPAAAVGAVARVAVNLRGLAREEVCRGDALVAPGRWLSSTVVDVRLHSTSGSESDPGPGADELPAQLSLHIGAAAVPARPRPLGADHARLTLAGGLPLRIGDRGLLRDPGGRRIVAGLTVLDVRPPPLVRRGAAAARGAELAGRKDPSDPLAELGRRGLVGRDELAAMGAGAPPDGAAVAVRDWLLDRRLATELAGRLVALVAGHDADDPLDPGLPVGAARRSLGLPDQALVDALLTVAPARGRLTARDGRLHRLDGPGGLPDGLRRTMTELRAAFADHPYDAPDAARLAELGLGTRQLAALVKAGELLRISDGIYLLPGAERSAAAVLAAAFGEREFTVSQARRALGTTRRVAVPLLELLARQGHTRRTPEGGHRLAAHDDAR
ncbi:MAG: selenocysteine-specific translation elongation factor [Pseudonocardia sp.]